jgi:hypothetical protein
MTTDTPCGLSAEIPPPDYPVLNQLSNNLYQKTQKLNNKRQQLQQQIEKEGMTTLQDNSKLFVESEYYQYIFFATTALVLGVLTIKSL